jgi:peroxiredoxin (alkyl hydroperoxide reductase subunit C)
MPELEKKAPSFKAVTTQGDINSRNNMQETGLFFSAIRADFTPVCTSEFMTFATP